MSKLRDFSKAWQAATGFIGQAVWVMMTEAQFQSEYGVDWVLCDGRDVTGSKYHEITGNTTLPDGRGVFVRGKNNGRSDGNQNPDGELAEGAFQGDAMGSHLHESTNRTGAPTWGYGSTGVANVGGYTINLGTQVTSNTSPVGGNENRPKSITMNLFIKIN